MRARAVWVSIVLGAVVVAGCGSKKGDGPAGVGSTAPGSGGSAEPGSAAGGGAGGSAAAGSAAGKPAGYCVKVDPNNALASFAADEKTATFCVKVDAGGDDAKAPKPVCTSVDLATGAYRAATAEPPARAPSPTARTVKVGKAVEACAGDQCTKLDLPKLKEEEGEYQVTASADGKRLVATGGKLNGFVILDGKTGKKVKAVKAGSADECVESAHFLGDAVYLATSVCAGPGGSATIYSAAGKKLGNIDEDFNPYGATPLHVGGDHYALLGFSGGDVLVFDAKTGKQVSMMKIATPEDCEQCTFVLGDGTMWGTEPLEKLPNGKLVTIAGGGLAIMDPAAGKVDKLYPIPFCPAAK